MIKRLLTIIIFSIAFSVFSQQASLKGTVIDLTTREPISYASVILLNPADSSLVVGCISNSNGIFLIESVPDGSYQLHASHLGYAPYTIPHDVSSISSHPLLLELSPSETQLGEVVVRSSRPPISLRTDRKVIDATSFPSASVALDLLENIPSLHVSYDGKLTYRGDGGFVVYVNGKQVPNGEEKLRQIPASRIDRIELLTNPSSRYSAEGTAGVILVFLKKNRLEGYAIGTSLRYSTHDVLEHLLSVDHKSEKGGWYLEWQYGSYVWSDLSETYHRSSFLDDELFSVSANRNKKSYGITNNVEIGFNYDLTDRDNIDFSIYFQPFERTNLRNERGLFHERLSRAGEEDYNISYWMQSQYKMHFQYVGGQISYERTFGADENHTVSTYFDYSSYLAPTHERQHDYKYFTDRVERVGFAGTEVNEVAVDTKIEYIWELSDAITIESGVEVEINQIPKVTSVSGEFAANGTLVPFPGEPLNQNVDFSRDVFAAYLLFKNSIGEFDYQLGMRMEHSARKANYHFDDTADQTLAVPYHKKEVDFFPGFHSTYSFTETIQISAGYTRRIRRPRYYELVPLKQYSDPYSYYSGNEALSPAFSEAFEVTYLTSRNKDFFSVEVFGRKTTNVIQHFSRIVVSEKVLTTPENVGRSLSRGCEVMGGVDLFTWWNLNTSISLYAYRLKVNIDNAERMEDKLRSDCKVNNTFLLPKAFTLRWGLYYDSPQVMAQERQSGLFYSNLSVTKNIQNNRWQLNASCFNVLNSRKTTGTIRGDGFLVEYERKHKPYATFRVAYRFNNQK
ncbi:outer membrane beta-barrel family protein [Alkaliflexus imshenetskii]|uniref:outer membrane beta-barrel family protein n=1 Tax=Alkaliflexus imshenetskii TaxID=286730 RepID=UPI000478AD40|nr:outer membrane beta-barrel family protein [Alkaliflexus imshenetskii]